MKLLLFDRNAPMIEAWRSAFEKYVDARSRPARHEYTVCSFPLPEELVAGERQIALVSPANSFGFMDGGIDATYTAHFGSKVQEQLQKVIAARPLRELLVGEAITVNTDDVRIPWVICAPTMRTPRSIAGTLNVYLAFKAVLSEYAETVAVQARNSLDVRMERDVTLAVPGLGAGSGLMPYHIVARQMAAAWDEFTRPPIRYTSLNDASFREQWLRGEY